MTQAVMDRSVALAPTQTAQRIELLDVVRGLALLGIVSANMIIYSLYLYLPASAKSAMSTHASDRVLDFLELFLIEGKFYTIFAVLFGLGFSVLLSRARTKDLVFHRFYLRRVSILFLIGVAHAVLFWHDDILQAYAVCGALLLAFVTARSRTIVMLGVLAYLAPIPIKLAGGMPVGVFTDVQNALFDRFGFTRGAEIDMWTRGTVGEIVRLNMSKVLSQMSFLLASGMIFKIYGCFLLGFYIGRHEIYGKLESGRRILKRMAIGGFALGLPLNAVYAATFDSGSWLETLSGTLGILPLSCGYVAACCLIWLDGKGRDRLRHFAPVGRMALTNYVGQSVICTLLFYGTGLGLGGTMGPTLYLPIGFAVYAVQVITSRLWLERFRFGPLEWLWRVLTYGAWLPLGKRQAA
jgi:uncharacterized protein